MMIEQRQLRGIAVYLTGVLAILVAAERLTAQFSAEWQGFDGTIDTYFAEPPGSVPYWSVDGGCSPALVFQDGTRGDNGSKCLVTLQPVGIGTRMIKDLNPGAGSSTFGEIVNSNHQIIGRLLMTVDDGSGTIGQELYQVLAPLYPITTLVMDIMPGAGSSAPSNMFRIYPGTPYDVYFSADDGTNGRELWKFHTHTGGELDPPYLDTTTALFKDIHPTGSSNPSEFQVAANNYYYKYVVFAADNGTNGRELWVTDGVTTYMLMDINTSSLGASSDPQQMTSLILSWSGGGPYHAKAFFTADNGVDGRELWRTNGTVGGTGLVMDIVAGPTGSNPTNLTPVDLLVDPGPPIVEAPTMFFTVNSDAANGTELWKSLGALGGADTEMVYDPGAAGSPANLTAVDDLNLLFFTIGNALWKSDGTTVGTVSITTFAAPPANLLTVPVGETEVLYFTADDGTGNGVELWKSGGTTTSLVKDIASGAASSSPANLTAVGGKVYFSADDGTNGRELWRTDDTVGAVMVKNINPGSADSNPSNLHNLGWDGTLIFTADDGTHGTELWQSDGYVDPPYSGMSYKWDLSSDIQDRGDPSKVAVAGTDTNVLYTYWLYDFEPIGGGGGDISEPAHQTTSYLELTDGVDRAPLDVTYVDCGDTTFTRPKAALTDGSNHNAIAFGMVAVLDQDPCDTDPLGAGIPSVPFTAVPAVYDGHDWIPMNLTNFPAGVPTFPPTTQVMGQAGPDTGWPGYMAIGYPTLEAATMNPKQTKRFAYARLDVYSNYIAVVWGCKQYDTVWVATLERKYKGNFKALYIGNKACLQQNYPYYFDSVILNGGLFVSEGDPYGACCYDTGVCEDGLTAVECDGTYTEWMTCSDPDLVCCPTPWADPDNDGDVDLVDFGQWQLCFTGGGGGVLDGCKCYDRDDSTGALPGDGDVDGLDFVWFENCFTGSTVLLTDPPPAGCIP